MAPNNSFPSVFEEESNYREDARPAKVYLAGPYSHEDPEIRERRFQMYSKIAARLMEAGMVVFSPISHTHRIEHYMKSQHNNWDMWRRQDFTMLDRMDFLCVVPLIGWRDSTGVQAEIERAQHRNMQVTSVDPIMHGTTIVGISGKKRSGKDTAAQFLAQNHGFERVAFADPLKEAVRAKYGWTTEHTDGEKKEENDPYWNVTRREAMQKEGVRMRDGVHKDFWIKRFQKDLLQKPRTRVVVPDVRFPNELHYIRTKSGYTYRIDASKRLSHSDDHESENALDETDFGSIIDNNGSKSEFIQRLQHSFEWLNDG